MTYITATEIRYRSGVPSSLISDTQMTQFITTVEANMQKWLNTPFTPTERIEIRNGNNTERMFLKKNPVLSVKEITVNSSTSVTPAYVIVYKESGKIVLDDDAESATFVSGNQNTYIKYLHGLVEESSTSTTTSADVSAGSSVALTVSSISGFADDDWVEIYGMDGKREVAQISGDPAGSTITVDKLVKSHESGSVVVKLQIPDHIKEYMIIEGAICAAINAIGATYTFNASYSLGDLQVTKGVPYTHWEASMRKLIDERKVAKERIKIRPSIMV